MDDWIFDRLAPTGAPKAWLAVLGPGSHDYIVEVASSAKYFDVPSLEQQWVAWLKDGKQIVVVEDSPSLSAQYQGGLYSCGYDAATPAHLTARKNWFLRYRDILVPSLRDPAEAVVHFFSGGSLRDPLMTMRSSRTGPFPFPAGMQWPGCRHCSEPMSFVSALDFRPYKKFGAVRDVPNGSLALHYCEDCGETSVQWLVEGGEIAFLGDGDLDESTIQIGEPYPTIEFPTPALSADNLSDDAKFQQEWGIYQNFSCPLTKIGGHCFWIQGDQTPSDRNGTPMKFIGQFIGSQDVELADGGMVYVFFSEDTKETEIVLQFY